MRIAIINVKSAFSVDGINFFVWGLANGLITEGHEVYVVSGYDGNHVNIREMFDVNELPKIVTLSRKKPSEVMENIILLWLLRGWHVINQIAPDMLILNGIVPLHSSSFKVAVCHDLEFRYRLQKWYGICLYRMFDKITTTSTELKKRATYELKLNPSKITRIPICINTKKYSPLNLNEREHAILHVGTWSDKNLKTTVEAFQIIAKKDFEIKLYVVGPLWTLPLSILSNVENRIKRRIICLGKISKRELKEVYSKVKVTCVPSLYRVPVLSPTVLESLASGNPIIGSSLGISKDILIHGYNGFRIDPKDSISMATEISILIRDNELWNEMSKNALTLIRTYDTSVVAKKYIELYHQWLNG